MSDSNEIRIRLDGLRTDANDFATAINDALGEVNTLIFTGDATNIRDIHSRFVLTIVTVIKLNGEYSKLDTLIKIARFKLPPGCDTNRLKAYYQQELDYIHAIYITPFVLLYHAVNNTLKRADVMVSISKQVGGDELAAALLAFSNLAKSSIPRNRL
jgi:hypothetical protein